jgi:hypothetical protein
LGSPPGSITNKRLFYCAGSRHSVLLSVPRSFCLAPCPSPCLTVEFRTGCMQLAVLCCICLRCAVWQLQRKQLYHEFSVYWPPSEAYKMTYLPFVKQLMPLPEATGFCSRGRSLSPCSIFEDQRVFFHRVGLSPGVPLSVLSITVQIEKFQRASLYVVRPARAILYVDMCYSLEHASQKKYMRDTGECMSNATSREQLVRPEREHASSIILSHLCCLNKRNVDSSEYACVVVAAAAAAAAAACI